MASSDKAKSSNRKTFDFRMSKKVAELTQVVHMLFTRNHERELETQLLKDLYNKELDRLHHKYQTQLDTAEKKIAEQENKISELTSILDAKVKEAVKQNDDTWTSKYDTKENQYLAEKCENIKLQDMIAALQQEITSLTSSSNDSTFALSTQLNAKDEDIDRLKKELAAFVRKMEDDKQMHRIQAEKLKEKLAGHEQECDNLRSLVDEYRINEEASAKKKQKLEEELASLKKEVGKKAVEIMNIRRSALDRPDHAPSNMPPTDFRELHYQQNREVYEELENLRQLVQKYRLELSNREGNFNRVFAEKTPVHINNRASLGSLASSVKAKDKTFSYALGQGFDSFEAAGPVLRAESSLSSSGIRRLSGIKRAPQNNKILSPLTRQRL